MYQFVVILCMLLVLSQNMIHVLLFLGGFQKVVILLQQSGVEFLPLVSVGLKILVLHAQAFYDVLFLHHNINIDQIS